MSLRRAARAALARRSRGPAVVAIALLALSSPGLLATPSQAGLARPAAAGGPSLRIGVCEDAVREPTVAAAKQKLSLVRRAGFDTVCLTETWAGQTAPPPGDLVGLKNAVAAARLLGMHVIVSVFPFGSSETPLTAGAREQFAQFAASLASSLQVREFIVGNEPNLNRFWLPQFNANGSDAAAPAFLELLVQAYHALKGVDSNIVVDAVGVSAHGSDRPGARRQTHSPTAFIQDLGAAYRASGGKLPIMDAFDIHPYEDNSSILPTFADPHTTTISIADYGKLEALLGRAFDGTAQPGSRLAVVYGEFGVETLIPSDKRRIYTGTEPSTTKPVDAITQGRYYREAIALSFCQPRVRTLLMLHAFDEPSLAGWQSGVYYANGTPKASLPIVQQAIRDARRGIIARCPGLALTPAVPKVVWPSGRQVARQRVDLRLECSIDCTYAARLEDVRTGRPVLTARGRLVGEKLTRISLRGPVRVGRYRVRLTLVAPVNPGPPRVLVGPAFSVR